MSITLETVVSVVPHEEANSPMDIVTMSSGRINVANRDDPNTPRYQYGDTALVIPADYIIPEWLLKHNDLWNEEKGKGYLKGNKGNRSCVRNIAGVPSEVMLVAVSYAPEEHSDTPTILLVVDDGLMFFDVDSDKTVIMPDVLPYINPETKKGN